MHNINYPVKHQYQTTNHNCSQTALSILLSHYSKNISVENITSEISLGVNNLGEPIGTINQQLATWCIGLGYKVKMYTFDCQVIDQSWGALYTDALIARLDEAKAYRNVAALGAEWSAIYLQSYIDFLNARGELIIRPYVSSALLYALLNNGPLLACVCFNTLYGTGRSRNTGLRQSVLDDMHGTTTNHSIVIHGVTNNGEFVIADPWEKPGTHTIEPDRMLAAITAAQIECDNLFFQINTNN